MIGGAGCPLASSSWAGPDRQRPGRAAPAVPACEPVGADPAGGLDAQAGGCRTRVGQGRPRGPVDDLGGAGCPNLLQRPGSRRSAREESLIFRGSAPGRSGRRTPLQQIWTSPRPGASQESHAHHRAGAPATASPDEGGGRPSGAERSPRGAIFPLRTGPQGPAHESGETHGRPGLGPPGRFSRTRRFPVERAAGRCALDWKPARSRRSSGTGQPRWAAGGAGAAGATSAMTASSAEAASSMPGMKPYMVAAPGITLAVVSSSWVRKPASARAGSSA